jgi:chemotaxis protein MotD
MTTSIGAAVPGFAPPPAPSKQPAANARSEDSFDKMVRGTENPSKPENQRTTEKAGRHDPQWAKRPFAGLGKAAPAHGEPGKTASPKLPAGKTAKDDTDPGKADADAEQTGQAANAAPLQDHLPLLMALHDIRHFSSSAKTGGHSVATDGQTQDPALDGQPRSAEPPPSSSRKNRSPSGMDTNTPDAMSRSERASVTASLSATNQGRQPDEIGPAFEEPSHQDGIASHLLKDQAATDISAPQAKQTTPATKGIEAVRSAAPSGPGKQASSSGRIDVLGEQSFPAPSQNPMSQTTSALVDAIASDSDLRQALSTPPAASQMASSVAVPRHILKIELHPAELGMVTASLRLAGEQLSIELKPETHEAYRRLTADSEAIVKSMRGLGFDVDKVAILQPSIAVPTATRTDAGSSLPMSSGRDQPSFQPGNSSGSNAGSGGQKPGRNHNNDAQEFGRAASLSREHAGDDMFI